MFAIDYEDLGKDHLCFTEDRLHGPINELRRSQLPFTDLRKLRCTGKTPVADTRTVKWATLEALILENHLVLSDGLNHTCS